MFEKILVANRGEVALSCMRTCKELGIATVAVYSELDAQASFVAYADESVCIGPADPELSYRNANNILSAALITGCQAIYPGYGYFASDPSFISACAEHGITFIGPDYDSAAFLGEPELLLQLAKQCGVPTSYGLETQPLRMVEVPVLVDSLGNRVILCERDCTISLNGESLVEEAPAAYLSDATRRSMGVSSQKLLRALDFCGLAFLRFAITQDGSFYLDAVSFELSRGYGVVEVVSGVDLIAEQIRISAGESLSCTSLVPFSRSCHVVGFCVRVKDSAERFAQNPGTMKYSSFPGGLGIRLDTQGGLSQLAYGPYGDHAAHLMAWGNTRESAIARGKRALSEIAVEGVETTISIQQGIMGNAAYNEGDIFTDFMESEMGVLQ